MEVCELANTFVLLSSLYTAMLAALWAYPAWISVGFIGGVIKDATRNISRRNVTRPREAAIGMILILLRMSVHFFLNKH